MVDCDHPQKDDCFSQVEMDKCQRCLHNRQPRLEECFRSGLKNFEKWAFEKTEGKV
jgi:hypothetical protein